MSLFREIVWGKKEVASQRVFKYAMLRGEFAIIIILVGVFYIFLDIFNSIFSFLPWYTGLIFLSLVILVLNRRGRYLEASVLILFLANSAVYLFADVDHPQGGIFFYFMTASMAGLILASYYDRRAGIFFAFLPIVLAYLAFLFDTNILSPPSSEAHMVRINFLANFTVGLLSTMLLLNFLLTRNRESEESLLTQNKLLEKTNHELDQFVYSVSHDLRAPLSSILGLTSIYDLTNDEKERARIIGMIRNRATTLDSFIGEVLDYSRNTRLEPICLPLSVRELIEETWTGVQHMPGVEEVSLEIQCAPDLVVSTDRRRLKVILNNLVTNAINYRDPAKKSFLKIASHVEAGTWTIWLEDNGIGIKEEHQDKIFNMFYKAHDKVYGSGLGLYIVRETLQRLRGKIEVRSAYTVGSTFTITLPECDKSVPGTSAF